MGPRLRRLELGRHRQQRLLGTGPAHESAIRSLYSAAADQVNVFLGERDNRVCKGRDGDPRPPACAAHLPLIFLAITTITVSLFIQTHRPSVDIAVVVVVSVIVGSGLLTAMILQYPYSGAIAVKSDPLAERPLSHLSDGT
jgi:hypothetical protein